jgi:hypothetical protein
MVPFGGTVNSQRVREIDYRHTPLEFFSLVLQSLAKVD